MNGTKTHTDAERRPEEEEKRKEEEEPLCDDPFVVVKGGDDGCDDDTPSTSTITTDPPPYIKKGWGVRHTVLTMTCMGVILLSMTRYGISIAIVSMASHPPTAHTPTATTPHPEDPTHGLEGVEVVGVGQGACPAPENVTLEDSFNETTTMTFDWDETTQGLILGAFYYGNVLTNILGGRMSERVGSKPVILLGMFLTSALSILSPLAAYLHTNAFIAVRLFSGFAQGIVMPAVSRCLVVWVPPFKRSKYSSIVFIGSEVGIMLALAVGGWLCSQTFLGGWPAVFYVFGGAGVLWCLAWVLLVHDSPENHTRITSDEKKYLMTHCVVRQDKDKKSVPWMLVLRSLPFWAVAIMHIGHNWGYYTFVSELPVYLSNIQHFSIKSNGLMSALPYFIKTVFALLFGYIMDRATAWGKLSVLSVRRMSMMVASYLPAAALVVMCFVECDSVTAVVVMSAAIGVTGATFCGLFCSHQDISPHFAGTIYGVTNSMANITGIVVPGVVGLITFENQTLRAWNAVFLLAALIYVLTCTFYVICVTDKVQPFDTPPQVPQVEDGVQESEKSKIEYTQNHDHLQQSPSSTSKSKK